jgi:hypothetical protein
MDVRQFDGRLGKHALLNVTWMLVGPDSDTPLVVRRTIIQEAVSEDNFDALVEAQSRALEHLCQEIAGSLFHALPPP